MKRSRYDELAKPPLTTRYGLTETEWAALSPDERAVHYNRQHVCDHPYVYTGPDNDQIKLSWSFDPYAHTDHMLPHSVEGFFAGTCECQTCVGKFGIPRDQEKRRVDAGKLRERLKELLN